jgi:hypothetical protein
MRKCNVGILAGTALAMSLVSTGAEAHWCDDLWASSYNLAVRPDSDTSPKEVYVQNNMGYQLINFKLSATGTSGAITLTAPTTLKVSGTLLPGEKGIWKIASGSPAKIEDITFSVSFGNSGQSRLYPTSGAKAVMVVKADGSLYPAPPPPGLDTTSGNQGRSLQYSAVADFEDVDVGLDKLLQLYCAGRGSWNTGSDAVVPTYCSSTSSTTCPAAKSGSGSKYDYMHLWSAGELAIRKASLGARGGVFRARLQCGANDSDVGFAGYALFILGYLGDDANAKTFLQTQASGSGDLATIAKAALYLMGDTAQKSAVQSGAQSSSVFVKVACAAALGIVEKDDAIVTSQLIPEVKWIEPDTSDDGKGMYAAHILELVAFQRRGWVANGMGPGAVTFYGETGSSAGTGGVTGSGGSAGSGGVSGSGGTTGRGGSTGSGGRTGAGGTPGSGGTSSSGGTVGSGGSSSSGGTVGSGGEVSSGGNAGSGGVSSDTSASSASSGGMTGSGGSPPGSGGDTGSSVSPTTADSAGGCKCNLGGHSDMHVLTFLALAVLPPSFRRRRH